MKIRNYIFSCNKQCRMEFPSSAELWIWMRNLILDQQFYGFHYPGAAIRISNQLLYSYIHTHHACQKMAKLTPALHMPVDQTRKTSAHFSHPSLKHAHKQQLFLTQVHARAQLVNVLMPEALFVCSHIVPVSYIGIVS